MVPRSSRTVAYHVPGTLGIVVAKRWILRWYLGLLRKGLEQLPRKRLGQSFYFGCCVFFIGLVSGLFGQEIRVPAFTAYMSPFAEGARVSENRGITRWTNPEQVVQWFGKFDKTGEVNVSLELSLPADVSSKLQMTFGDRSMQVDVRGRSGNETVTANFGAFSIDRVGHHEFRLKSLNESGVNAGEIKTLIVAGPATQGAHFNLKERRNAASVHLKYAVPEGTKAEAFYSEVTAVEDPIWSFYMACGWHRGYFGMQVNSPTERRIIFSVWDSGNEAVDRKKVDDANRVKLIGKGEGVYSGDFGNEGTGGHSHLKYLWKTGEKQRFVVLAKPVDNSSTIFAGYWFHPGNQEWMLISAWRAPKEGGWLRGLHGFSENFVGGNGHLLRKALYGNQWVRTSEGKWIELSKASFSYDPTGKSDRFDRFMGIEHNQFFLSHGGFKDGFSKFGDEFVRPELGIAPDIESIKVPE
ncbi:MAG: DUF3472 domain-containing protein [Pirellula sp.]